MSNLTAKIKIWYRKYFLAQKMNKETFWSLLTKGSTFILFFGMNVVLARALGVEKYGAWSFYSSLLLFYLQFSYFGINTSARTFMAKYNGTPHLSNIIRDSVILRVIVGIFTVLPLVLFHRQIEDLIGNPLLAGLVLIAAPLTFFSNLSEFLKAAFNGLHRLIYNFVVNSLEYGLKLLFVVALLTFSTDLTSVAWVNVLALFVASTIGLWLLYKKFYNRNDVTEKSFLKEIFRYSIPLLIISVGFSVSTEIDTILLGFLRDTHEVGIYSVAKQIVNKLPQISLAVTMGTMPVFAKMNRDNIDKMEKLFKKLVRYNLYLFGLIILGIAATAWFLIPLLFGPEYKESVLPLMILLPYLFSYSYAIYLSAVLDYQGMALSRAFNLLLTVVLNIGLNLYLIPKYGPVGAAIGTTIAYLPYVIQNYIEVRKLFERIRKQPLL